MGPPPLRMHAPIPPQRDTGLKSRPAVSRSPLGLSSSSRPEVACPCMSGRTAWKKSQSASSCLAVMGWGTKEGVSENSGALGSWYCAGLFRLRPPLFDPPLAAARARRLRQCPQGLQVPQLRRAGESQAGPRVPPGDAIRVAQARALSRFPRPWLR